MPGRNGLALLQARLVSEGGKGSTSNPLGCSRVTNSGFPQVAADLLASKRSATRRNLVHCIILRTDHTKDAANKQDQNTSYNSTI